MDIRKLRREYSSPPLNRKHLDEDPLKMFQLWFEKALKDEIQEANALCLSTVSKKGRPSSRIVLLKEFSEEGFVFYTNYESRKGKELEDNPHAAMNFFWKEYPRQVHIEGVVQKLSPEQSSAYFQLRNKEAQLGAHASFQDKVLESRAQLDDRFKKLVKEFEGKEVPRPYYWGGYKLLPSRFEFWQGRENRLHDRFSYEKNESSWEIKRRSP